MKRINSWLRENFGYGKKEINGSIVLLFAILLSFIGVYAYDYYKYASNENSSEKDLEVLGKWAAELKWAADRPEFRANERSSKALSLKEFNPNSVSENELLEMEIPAYLAANWVKYTARGGKFFEKEDLLKLYGMDSSIFHQIEPFLLLTKRPAYAAISGEKAGGGAAREEFPVVLKEINLATAEELQVVKGIGPAYSQRIVKYRNALGGFHKKSQLHEVYGLSAETVEAMWGQFYLDSTACCTKTSVNLIALDSLKKQPYLNYNQARALIAYRDQHGRFEGWHEVAKIKIIPDSTIQKLKPYFEF